MRIAALINPLITDEVSNLLKDMFLNGGFESVSNA